MVPHATVKPKISYFSHHSHQCNCFYRILVFSLHFFPLRFTSWRLKKRKTLLGYRFGINFQFYRSRFDVMGPTLWNIVIRALACAPFPAANGGVLIVNGTLHRTLTLRVLPALFIRYGKIVTMVRKYENKQQHKKICRSISHLRRFSAFLFRTPYIRLWSATDLARRSVHFIFFQFHVNVYSIAFEFDLSIYCIGFRVEIFIANVPHLLCSTFEAH